MAAKLARKNIIVKKSSIDHFGVFAAEDILTNTVIEECYAIMISGDAYQTLRNYVFRGKNNSDSLLSFGYGSIFNHSATPNASFSVDHENSLIVFTSMRRINKGEEILISYGDTWFSARNLTPRKPSWKNSIRKNMPLFKKMVRAVLVIAIILMGASYLAHPSSLHVNSFYRRMVQKIL